jgi:hypothetical protein
MQKNNFLEELNNIQKSFTLPHGSGYFQLDETTSIYSHGAMVVAIFKKEYPPMFITDGFSKIVPMWIEKQQKGQLSSADFDSMVSHLDASCLDDGYHEFESYSIIVRDRIVVGLHQDGKRLYRSNADLYWSKITHWSR